VIAGFEERGDASKPIYVVPHDGILRLRWIMGQAKSVLEDYIVMLASCTEELARAYLTIETFFARL
jgi:hypothetical protein